MSAMKDADWELHKGAIERIYMREDKKLPELRAILNLLGIFKREHSKAEYERKFKQWGFVKYRMRKEDWRCISNRIEKRKRESGKDSEVYIDGVQCPPIKVRRETARHGFVSTIEKFRPAPSPKTPEGIVVCSPGPSAVQLKWEQTLPWFQFLRLIRSRANQGTIPLFKFAAATAPHSVSTSSDSTSLAYLSVSSDVIRGLGSILQWSSTRALRDIQSSSRASAVLSVIMPEEYEGQHLTTAESLCSPKDSTGFLDRLNLELFLLSNNFTYRQQYADLTSSESARLYDERIMGILRRSGMNSLHHFRLLLSMEATAAAVAEKLFASALRCNDLETIQMMRKAGMNPDILIDTPEWACPLTPLELAASVSDERLSVRMARLLLSYKGQVNRGGRALSALCHATERKNRELMEILIASGAHILPMSLKLAIDTEDITLIQMLLDAGADVNAKISVRNFENGMTALGIAVGRKNLRLTKILLANRADVDAPQPTLFGLLGKRTTALGIAAQRGNAPIAKLLLEAHANVNLPAELYDCPLVLAVREGHNEVAKLLLNAGADIHSAVASGEETLLERAAYNGDAELCLILLAKGARVNRPISGNGERPSALIFATTRGSVEVVSLLLSYEARVNDVYFGKTALTEAIRAGNSELIQMLLRAGATTIGEGIFCIGNIETANHLEQVGMLPDIIRTSGPSLLASAISAEKEDLVQRLLSYDIDVNEDFSRRLWNDGPSPLEAAISKGNIELAEVLIGRGAHTTGHVFIAAVWEALGTGNDTIVRKLVGSYNDLPRYMGSTAVDMAVQQRSHGLVQLLLEVGIDPKGPPRHYDPPKDGFRHHREQAGWWRRYCQDKPESVLETAAQLGDRPILQLLLKATKGAQRCTGLALTVAINYHNDHLVQDLLDAGADVDSERHEYGMSSTPLCTAVARQQISLVETLLLAGANVDYSRTTN
ncbi:ankyrin repeat-containing domain protein [Leptodontidium sp. 2 PMI_412]|nr:ankyrin repeat-containing domain protein [Leptodontidium sp. 2 PMI_412]